MQLRRASVNEITGIDLSFSSLNIGQLLENNSVLTWVNNLHLYTNGKIGYFVHKYVLNNVQYVKYVLYSVKYMQLYIFYITCCFVT